MAPSTFDHVVIPASAYMSSPTDYHRLPLRKPQIGQLSSHVSAAPQPRGGPESHPRLLTVDEALQYSPLSSIVPLSLGRSLVNLYRS